MAIISTITIGSTDYSVYALTSDPVADADAYLAARIGSTWATATTLQKQQSIITAARVLDRSVRWVGTKTVASQAREFPRDGMINGCTGEAITDGTIPDDIAYAEFELAGLLFTDASIADSTGTGSNVRRVKAGSAEVEFFQSTIDVEFSTRLPTPVNDLARCYMQSSNVGLSTRFGDEVCEDYDSDDYDTIL